MRGSEGSQPVHACVCARICERTSICIFTPIRTARTTVCVSAGTAPGAATASRQEFQIAVQKLQATSSAPAERKSPLFKDSWQLQEHILFQIVMFGQFTLFIRFEINGSQSQRKVNKRLQKVLSHATRLARLRHWGPRGSGKGSKRLKDDFHKAFPKTDVDRITTLYVKHNYAFIIPTL